MAGRDSRKRFGSCRAWACQPTTFIPSILGRLKQPLESLSQEDAVVLELAATYDAFCKMGLSHDTALESLMAKKGDKCGGGQTARALDLLKRVTTESDVT